MRAAALFAALLTYGLFGVPAPATVGAAELVLALLLVLASGLVAPALLVTGGTLHRDRPGAERAGWEVVAPLALALLLWPPLLRGVAQGWDPRQIVRDLVPLLFLFLPAVLVPLLRRVATRAERALSAGLALAGLLFALRWWEHAQWGFGAVGTRAMPEGADYLLNAPSVLFAAVALPLAGLAGLAGRSVAGRLLALPAFLAGALCLGALAGAVHRMALGLALLALCAGAAWWARRTPLLVGCLAGLALAVAWWLDGVVAGTVLQVVEKSRVAGINARGAEAAAVLALVAADPVSLLVGEGWGALLENPAVGGWRVPYTHTLASYALFKAGAVGALALLAWLAALARPAWRLLWHRPLMAAALLPPLAVAVGLHTSFKYLDCGLLLTVMVLCAESIPRPLRHV